MNKQLQDLFEDAENRLAASDQALLAELVMSFVLTHEGSPEFDPAELAHLKNVDAEQFDAADPVDVERMFQKRG